MNSRKMIKLLILTITSLLIAGASAQVYSYMYMTGTVGVETIGMKFVAGADFVEAGGALSDNDQRVTFSQMNGIAGQRVEYPEPVNITNNDLTAHDIELVLDSWTGIVTDPLYNVTISMYDSTGKQGASIVLVPGDGLGHVTTSGDVTIPGSTTWRVEWTIYWTGSATTANSVVAYLQLVIKT